jgi:hypothetical protein
MAVVGGGRRRRVLGSYPSLDSVIVFFSFLFFFPSSRWGRSTLELHLRFFDYRDYSTSGILGRTQTQELEIEEVGGGGGTKAIGEEAIWLILVIDKNQTPLHDNMV